MKDRMTNVRPTEMNRRTVSILIGLSILAIVFFSGCHSSNVAAAFDPKKAESVVLYDIDPRETQDYSKLPATTTSYKLKSDEVRMLFAQTKKESLRIWKGAFLAVVHCKDDKEYHLAISYFGGFARVLETGQVIKFDGASGVEYERIKGAALRDVFIPERQRKNQANTN